jgi:hypothetical protein
MKIAKFPERIRQLNSVLDQSDFDFFIPILNFGNGIDANYVNRYGIETILTHLEVELHAAIGNTDDFDSIIKEEE